MGRSPQENKKVLDLTEPTNDLTIWQAQKHGMNFLLDACKRFSETWKLILNDIVDTSDSGSLSLFYSFSMYTCA